MGVPGGRAECLTPSLGAMRHWKPLDSPLWQATPRGFRCAADGDNEEVPALSRSRPFTPLLGSDRVSRPHTPGSVSRPRTAGSAAAGVEAARAAGDAARAAADAALAAARLFCVEEEVADIRVPSVEPNQEGKLPSTRPFPANTDAKQADETKPGRDHLGGFVGACSGSLPVKCQDEVGAMRPSKTDLTVKDFLGSLLTSQQEFEGLDRLLLRVGKAEPECKQDLPQLSPSVESTEPAPEPPVGSLHILSTGSRARSPSPLRQTDVPEKPEQFLIEQAPPKQAVDPDSSKDAVATARASSSLPSALQAGGVESFLEGLSNARTAFDERIQAWTPRVLKKPRSRSPSATRRTGQKEAKLDAQGKLGRSAKELEDAMRPWQSPISGRTSLRRISSEDSTASCEDDGSQAAEKQQPVPPEKLVERSTPCMDLKQKLRAAKTQARDLDVESLEEDQRLQQRPPRPGKVHAPKEPPTMGNLAAMAAFAGRNLEENQSKIERAPSLGKLRLGRRVGSDKGSSQDSEEWQRSRTSQGYAEDPEDIIRLPALSKPVKARKVSSLRDIYRRKEAFKLGDHGEKDQICKTSPPVSKPGSARSDRSAFQDHGLAQPMEVRQKASPGPGMLPLLPRSSRSMNGAAAEPVSSSIRRSHSAADVRVSASGMASPRRPRSDRGRRGDTRLLQAIGAPQLSSSRSTGALC